MNIYLLISLFSINLWTAFINVESDTSATYPTLFYHLETDFDPDGRSIDVHLTLTIPVHFIEEKSLSFLFSSSAQVYSVSGEQLIEYSKNEVGPELSIYNLQFDNLTESEIAVELIYSLAIPDEHQVNRISKNYIELNIDSFWHPVLMSFPRFHYKLISNLGELYHILTGDNAIISPEHSDKWIIESKIPRFDISFIASKQFYSREGNYSRVYSTSNSTDLDTLLQLSEEVLSFLKKYSQRPEDFIGKRIVVESPRDEVGYARENYVVLSKLDNMDTISISLFLAHEFSHYWFLQADPQSLDHWLNESFSEFLAMIYIRDTFGERAYLDIIDQKMQRIKNDPRPLASHQGRPSHIAMYYTGPIILHNFELYVGEDEFRLFLQQKIKDRISTTEELLLLIRNQFGTEAENKMNSLLNTGF